MCPEKLLTMVLSEVNIKKMVHTSLLEVFGVKVVIAETCPY